jgi:hypothetical protein
MTRNLIPQSDGFEAFQLSLEFLILLKCPFVINHWLLNALPA